MNRLKNVQFGKIAQRWQEMTIRQKIKSYMITVFLCIFISALFNGWSAYFSLGDFNDILSEGSKTSEFVQAIETESKLFEQFMKSRTEENEELLKQAMENTRTAIAELPFDYRLIGKERYSRTWSIRSCYEVYVEKRDAIFDIPQGTVQYVDRLYEIYDIQDYLRSYAADLMSKTLEAGSREYRAKMPAMMSIPIIVGVAGIVTLLLMVELSRTMSRTIVNPILKLAGFAKRIANNDFFIEDMPVESKDEIGELIRAFNKMKFATGEYILAMEDRRKAMDLLHEEELKKLEVERRLETMKLEVLVNQVNPHFLFNTLNVIGGMAMLENAETTEHMIMALSNLFRYNLKNSSSEAILSQELNVVRDYMYIQQMRFGERLEYQIDSSVEESRVVIPTFTFQPLVENAIIHGLGKKEEGGKIYIRVWEESGTTYITLEDTGVGIPVERLNILRGKLEDGNVSRDSIGVGNVYRRFKIMYPMGQFTISSMENEGTLIEMQIPQCVKRESEK